MYVRTKSLYESGDVALYAKDQSAAIRQQTETEYLYANVTSFSRYCESPKVEETPSESQLV